MKELETYLQTFITENILYNLKYFAVMSKRHCEGYLEIIISETSFSEEYVLPQPEGAQVCGI